MKKITTFLMVFVLLGPQSFAATTQAQGLTPPPPTIKSFELKDLAATPLNDEVTVTQSAIWGKGSRDIYKRMNYTTAALVIASLITSREGKATHDHKAIGAAAGTMFAAQTVFVRPSEGETKWSDGLYWASVPLLFIAPLLGGKRADDLENGKSSSGLVKEHKTIAKIGALTYLASVALWSFDF